MLSTMITKIKNSWWVMFLEPRHASTHIQRNHPRQKTADWKTANSLLFLSRYSLCRTPCCEFAVQSKLIYLYNSYGVNRIIQPLFVWQPPKPIANWTGVLNANKESAVCLQMSPKIQELFSSGAEDCLYLNVFTPQVTQTYAFLTAV